MDSNRYRDWAKWAFMLSVALLSSHIAGEKGSWINYFFVAIGVLYLVLEKIERD